MSTEADLAGWVATAESPTATPGETAAALEALLAAAPALGAATVFGILSYGPHYAPSRGLLVDPTDAAHRRWTRRVAAASALLASPAVVPVAEELGDEFAASAELARAVLATTEPYAGLPDAVRDRLRATATEH